MRAARTAAALIATVAATFWWPATASAQGCLIELVGHGGEVAFDGMAPGDQRQWAATVRNVASDPVDVVLEVDASGPLAGALDLEIDECSDPWTTAGHGAEHCAGTTAALLSTTPLDTPGADAELTPHRLGPGEQWNTRFTASMRASAGNEHQGADASAVAAYHASSGTVTCTVPDPEPPDPDRPDRPSDEPDDSTPPGRSEPPEPPGPRADPPDDGSGPRAPTEGPRGSLPLTGLDPRHPVVVAVALIASGLLLDRFRRRRDRSGTNRDGSGTNRDRRRSDP